MARDDLDGLLGALKQRPMEVSFDGLESAVWGRVEATRRAQASGGGVRTQVAVAIAALMIGAVVGGVTRDRSPPRSEMVVLSEDARLAPSVAIEGGA